MWWPVVLFGSVCRYQSPMACHAIAALHIGECVQESLEIIFSDPFCVGLRRPDEGTFVLVFPCEVAFTLQDLDFIGKCRELYFDDARFLVLALQSRCPGYNDVAQTEALCQ